MVNKETIEAKEALIKENINKFKNGLISEKELQYKLDKGFHGVHGAYFNNQFTGYDYENQQWIQFNY